jgi:tRNA-dihydrouridine synthase A
MPDRRFCIAPMIDCTDRHARYFLRLFSRHIVLFSEMITTSAIEHGDRERLLGFDESEHPVVLQLGGADPAALAASARVGAQYGYDEINLNVGCPSDRVQSGAFGACLMRKPELVADCVRAMKDAVDIPVSVKHRTGVDEQDSWEELQAFVETQIEAGVDVLYLHARKAWLQGLSPKENREIPPLHYDWAYRLQALYPDTPIILNGGIRSLDECEQHLQHMAGVMLGREPYANPWMLSEVDARLFGQAGKPAITRRDIMESYFPYVERLLQQGQPLTRVLKHILGLYHGQPGGKRWRRFLSEQGHRPGASVETLRKSLELVRN